MVVERIVDVRALEPPEPMHRVLKAARELAPGEYLAMHHRREPVPLYGLLAEMGLKHRTVLEWRMVESAETIPVRVLIWRCDDEETAAYCDAIAADPAAPDRPLGDS